MSAFRPVCANCGQPVRGEYLQALGKVWHPEHFVCKGCGRPIRGQSFSVHDGAPYHAECYDQFVAPRCAHCGKPLIGKYIVHDGASYHTECYSQFVAPRCAYCGKPLVSGWVTDHWGTQYCPEHQQQYPHCEYCGRLVSPQQQEHGAEVVRCPTCRSSAVETIEEARPLYERVKRWANSQGLTYSNLPLGLELCDRAKLAQLLRERGGSHSLGVTMGNTYTQDGHVIRTEVSGVAILHGLPATLFQGVTMHELGHVWLIVHRIQNLPAWAEEGFCEVLAYRYYQYLNTPEAHYHASSTEKNPDPIYGDGFRRVRALVDKHGFAHLLTTLDTTKQLPR
jgi:phage FluMu protein Com